jgi:phosphoglycolate phosphatase
MTFTPYIIGFDLDGTLLDTADDLACATNYALSTIGRPALPHEAIRVMVGGGARKMLRLGLEASGGAQEALLDALVPVLLEYYEAHICVHTQPYAGLLRVLDTLAARNIRLGVVTNKMERLALKLLQETGLASRFDCILGGDSLGGGKAKPKPDLLLEMLRLCALKAGEGVDARRALFVGDSRFDIDAAKNAGMPSVAVNFGFSDVPVQTLGADYILHHYDDFIALLGA